MDMTIFVCEQCGQPSLQKRLLCRSCHHQQLTEANVSGEGAIYSFSTIHISSAEFQQDAPYTVIVVELENGLKVTGRIKGEAVIGERVQVREKVNDIYYFEGVKATEVR
jgi:uncharacterized OB-fold protein